MNEISQRNKNSLQSTYELKQGNAGLIPVAFVICSARWVWFRYPKIKCSCYATVSGPQLPHNGRWTKRKSDHQKMFLSTLKTKLRIGTVHRDPLLCLLLTPKTVPWTVRAEVEKGQNPVFELAFDFGLGCNKCIYIPTPGNSSAVAPSSVQHWGKREQKLLTS